MVAQVIGIQRMKGISKKTGEPYDFKIFHIPVKDRRVEGLACKQYNLSEDIPGVKTILINQWYEFETDLDGNVLSVKPVKT